MTRRYGRLKRRGPRAAASGLMTHTVGKGAAAGAPGPGEPPRPGTGLPPGVPKPKPIGTPGGPRPAQGLSDGRVYSGGWCVDQHCGDNEVCMDMGDYGKCMPLSLGVAPHHSKRPQGVTIKTGKKPSRRKKRTRTKRRGRRFSGDIDWTIKSKSCPPGWGGTPPWCTVPSEGASSSGKPKRMRRKKRTKRRGRSASGRRFSGPG